MTGRAILPLEATSRRQLASSPFIIYSRMCHTLDHVTKVRAISRTKKGSSFEDLALVKTLQVLSTHFNASIRTTEAWHWREGGSEGHPWLLQGTQV